MNGPLLTRLMQLGGPFVVNRFSFLSLHRTQEEEEAVVLFGRSVALPFVSTLLFAHLR